MASRRGRLTPAKWERLTASKPPEVERVEPPRSVQRSRAGKPYRRAGVQEADEDGFVWVEPSATAFPARPRTTMVGYNLEEKAVRMVFARPGRNGAGYRYDNVSADEWERIRRTASTGRFINRVLNHKPYAPEDFNPPG